MQSKADTHIHTTYSDGAVAPETLVDYVVEQKAAQVVKALDMGGGWSDGFGRTSNGSHH